jgi:hypothetical protein
MFPMELIKRYQRYVISATDFSISVETVEPARTRGHNHTGSTY